VIEGEDGEHVVGITRAHMEEDPGKLVHIGSIEKSKGVLIDYNRSGMPLIETVTEPDMRSPKEARRFLDKFRNILEYLDVFDGNLEGAMRVDANVSVHWGTRVEIKNISSHKGVERALLYEIMRQKNVIRRGGKIVQETRHFDEGRGVTLSMRTKEEAEDYRYFREKTSMPMRVTDWIRQSRKPARTSGRKTRTLHGQYGITICTQEPYIQDHARRLYEGVCAKGVDPKMQLPDLYVFLGELNYRDLAISSYDGKTIGFIHAKDPEVENSFKVSDMVELVNLFAEGKISDRAAVEVIRTILDGTEEKTPSQIIEEKGLFKAEDDLVTKAVAETIAEMQLQCRLSGGTEKDR
jgi:aspartyl-tRNA(Asn)/glutamyl-tRNA(Gln) amidotransferase subunit B